VLGVPSLAAVGDAPARQIVRRELDVDVVARRDADAEPAQTTREAREDRVAVLELDLERRAGKRLDDAADEAQRVFFDDRGQRFTAFLAAAALASARWGNTELLTMAWSAVGSVPSPRPADSLAAKAVSGPPRRPRK
jgi:hypothetical protein